MTSAAAREPGDGRAPPLGLARIPDASLSCEVGSCSTPSWPSALAAAATLQPALATLCLGSRSRRRSRIENRSAIRSSFTSRTQGPVPPICHAAEADPSFSLSSSRMEPGRVAFRTSCALAPSAPGPIALTAGASLDVVRVMDVSGRYRFIVPIAGDTAMSTAVAATSNAFDIP